MVLRPSAVHPSGCTCPAQPYRLSNAYIMMVGWSRRLFPSRVVQWQAGLGACCWYAAR